MSLCHTALAVSLTIVNRFTDWLPLNLPHDIVMRWSKNTELPCQSRCRKITQATRLTWAMGPFTYLALQNISGLLTVPGKVRKESFILGSLGALSVGSLLSPLCSVLKDSLLCISGASDFSPPTECSLHSAHNADIIGSPLPNHDFALGAETVASLSEQMLLQNTEERREMIISREAT